MRDKYVLAMLGEKPFTTHPVWQWDKGLVLTFPATSAAKLPETFEMHWSNDPRGKATVQIGNRDGVLIPDEYINTGRMVYGWVYVPNEDGSALTVYDILIPVVQRAQPTDYEPTPAEQTAIDQAIAALNAAVQKCESAVDKTPHPENGVWVVWNAVTGEWVSTGISAQGPKGDTGVSPIVTVTDITGGHRVTVTDAYKTQTFDVMDGGKGDPGEPGIKGDPGDDYVITQENIEEIGGMVADSEAVTDVVDEMYKVTYGTDRNSVPVPSTDPHSKNNAKYYAQLTADAETVATQAIQAKGEEVLESIPADYTELSGEVSDLKSAFPIEPSNTTFLDAETVNLWDGSYLDGYALIGSGIAPSTQTFTANSARYNLVIVPIKPKTKYTICGMLTDGSTGYCKVKTATKLIDVGSKLDGSYGYDTTNASFVCTFTSGANDKYIYLYGYQSMSNSRAYMYQVREGVWSGFTTNEVGLMVGTTNEKIIVRSDDTAYLDTHNINICDGIPVDEMALMGNGATDQHLTVNSNRYNLYIMRCKPNTMYTVIAEINDDASPNMLKIKTATHKCDVDENLDGDVYIGIGSVTKERTQFMTGRNDRYIYIYGLHYTSNSRAHFIQVCEGNIQDFTTDKYGEVYGTPNDKLRLNAPIRIVPMTATSFRVYVLDSASRRYFRHDFMRQYYEEQLPYQSENPSNVVCADVWYSNNVYDPDDNRILQGNTNFIHYVSNKGNSHKGHVGASHGCAVATWTQFWADGRQFDPSTLVSTIECNTFRMVEKVVHYLNDDTTSRALYPTAWSTHAIPSLDSGGNPIVTGIEYLDGLWEINNKITIRNRFDVAIDDVQFSQMHAAMLCGFIPYMYDVQIESPDWLWTHVDVVDDVYTAVDKSGTGIAIPVGTTTPYMGYTATLFGEKVRATKTMIQRDPTRYGKSNILMWMPPNDDNRIKAYFQPCITTESPENETVETFGTGDTFDTVSVLKIDWVG